MGSSIRIPVGYDFDLPYTVESAPGVPKDISIYDRAVMDLDDAKGAVDKLSVEGVIDQVGSGAGATNKGQVTFTFANADTASWEGDVRIRASVRLRVTGSAPAKWHVCEQHPVVLIDRIPDAL